MSIFLLYHCSLETLPSPFVQTEHRQCNRALRLSHLQNTNPLQLTLYRRHPYHRVTGFVLSVKISTEGWLDFAFFFFKKLTFPLFFTGFGVFLILASQLTSHGFFFTMFVPQVHFGRCGRTAVISVASLPISSWNLRNSFFHRSPTSVQRRA